MTYRSFRTLALIFGLSLTLATTLFTYLVYKSPVEAIGQALFVVILVCTVFYFRKGGAWSAAGVSAGYIALLFWLGPLQGEPIFVFAAVVLRVTMYLFTGFVGGTVCVRVRDALADLNEADLIDHESGLFNRDYFYRRVAASVEMFERYDEPFSLLVFEFDPADIQALPRLERKKALLAVGREIKLVIRPSDAAGRTSETSIAFMLFDATGKKTEAAGTRILTTFHQILGDEAKIVTNQWSTPADIEAIRQYAHAR